MATRTLHPLPFEHLEPKRFEDLVRQLLYDFKPWRQLEATGRSGSDDGFDARAFEIVSGVPTPPDDGSDRGDEHEDGPSIQDRKWLIQCKREKAIGPKKIIGYLSGLPSESLEGLYGIVFVGACDFSKAARDAANDWAREHAISEIHVWGRGEIEDQLYQPKNDNLLFAYFGISLQIRRRSVATTLRATTTLKRKIRRHLPEGGWPGTPLILRDPADDRYPWPDGEILERGKYGWRPAHSRGLGFHGLRILSRCFHAFHDAQSGQWDVASAVDRSFPLEAKDQWSQVDDDQENVEREIISSWATLPQHHQGYLMVTVEIPFAEILEIDEVGDQASTLPTVFCAFRDFQPPFDLKLGRAFFSAVGTSHEYRHHPDRRVRLFPDHYYDPEWEKGWAEGTGLQRPALLYSVEVGDGLIWKPPAVADSERDG